MFRTRKFKITEDEKVVTPENYLEQPEKIKHKKQLNQPTSKSPPAHRTTN